MNVSEIAQANRSKWHPATPASMAAIQNLISQVGFELPSEYLDFLRFSNGGSGDIPVQPWYFDSLWTAEELLDFNRDYGVTKFCPGFFGIGSSGGGEMFAFDMRNVKPWPVVAVPFIGMEAKAALPVALNFCSFVEMFGQKEKS